MTPNGIDPAPLLGALGGLDDPGAAQLLGISGRTLIRWRTGKTRIPTVAAADEYACAIGLHPCSIWPDYWSWPVSAQEPLFDGAGATA